MTRLFGIYLLFMTSVWAQIPIHLVVDVQGQATLKRSHWQAENPLSFGTEVVLGDLLHLTKPSAQITVLCADLSLEIISGKEFSSIGCSEQHPVLYYQGDRIAPVRAPPALKLPRVLSPRATKLLSNRPMFHWEALEGASYTVRLKKLPNDLIWEIVTTTNTLPYPDEPPLEPGVSYILEVEAQVGDTTYSSSAEGLPNLGFRLLDETEKQKILSDEQKIQALPLSEMARAFVLAKLYASHELYAEASEFLLSALDNDEIALYYLLGKLHETILLPLRAESYYRDSLRLAEAAYDLEKQALSSLALAKLFDLNYNNGLQASEFYLLAQQSYLALGDDTKANGIKKILVGLGVEE